MTRYLSDMEDHAQGLVNASRALRLGYLKKLDVEEYIIETLRKVQAGELGCPNRMMELFKFYQDDFITRMNKELRQSLLDAGMPKTYRGRVTNTYRSALWALHDQGFFSSKADASEPEAA